MSLISNTDYLIHSLRLAYLRNAEDPYGPRLITVDPSYTSNPYIQAASLADTDRWPELAAPISPQPSDDDSERPSGFPGSTSLKHTQTIMGKRTGGLGLRVHGKRESTSSRRLSRLAAPKLDPEPVPTDTAANEVTVKVQEPSGPSEAPVAKPIPFIPKFKGAAEMEARRRQRMLARRGPGAPPPQPAQPINPEFSSSSEEEQPISEAEESADEDSDFGQASDEGDEFDPDFAASRSPAANLSDPSFILVSPSQTRPPRARLSPVTERLHSDELAIARHPAASSFEAVTSAPESKPSSSQSIPTMTASFPRRPVAPVKTGKSALSAMLATSSSSSANPFGELYAAISGRGQPAAMNVIVYFPRATRPANKPMELNVRKDATTEEVIGFALWSYWEEGWLPKLDEGVTDENDPKLSAIGWIMRIAEEDGEVDDEFPPPDRTAKISKFNFDAYAVMEATTAQIQQNRQLESKIQRRPSRIMAAKKVDNKLNVPANVATPSSAPISSVVSPGGSSLPLSTTLGPSSSHGPQIFLRIRVADTAHPIHISTTIPVTAGMYMQEVLEMICRKRKLENVKDFALLVRDYNIVIPPDRTVASLQGKRELLLVERSKLSEIRAIEPEPSRNTDPNASIFKRMSDVPQYAANDPTNAYKRYTVYRKQSMMISRQERTLAIDGVFIHIMPATNNGGKTYSYHIKSIGACEQSTKYTAMFKLVMHRSDRTSRSQRRFDFEAETPKLANEIVQTIKALMGRPDRSSTVGKSRRSRVVGKTFD